MYDILIIKDRDKIINIDYLCTDGHHAYDIISNHILFKPYIKKHIISKTETCLVESFNSYLRDNLARLKRKTKAYSKDQYMLEISLNLIVYKDIILNNINKYCLYYCREEYCNNKSSNRIDKDYKSNNKVYNKVCNKVSKNNKVWLEESVA